MREGGLLPGRSSALRIPRTEFIRVFPNGMLPARPLVDELVRQAPATADGPLSVGVPQLKFSAE